MEGTTRPTTSRQPLHQIVYRWQRQDLFGRKGLGPAATSLPVADLARLVPDLSEAVAAEFGGDGVPLTSTSLIHVDSFAAVVHRVASEFEQGRLGNHAHVLLGARAALTPHAVLALDGWTWRVGQPQLAEIPVGRRLARVPATILEDALAERAFQLRDAARTLPEALTVVLAAVLRRPTMGFSVRLADCGGDPVALLWGLFDLITVPLPGPLTFSTYETADGTTRPRFVVVPRWPSQLWSGRHRIDPDAEARTDVFREAAELMVRRYVEDDWDTMYPLLRGLQGLRRHQPYDRAVEIRERFGTGRDFGAGAVSLRLPNEEIVPGESAEALSRAATWQESRLAAEAGEEAADAAVAVAEAEAADASHVGEPVAVALPIRDVPPRGPDATLDELLHAEEPEESAATAPAPRAAAAAVPSAGPEPAPAATTASAATAAPESAAHEPAAQESIRPTAGTPLPRRTPNAGRPAIPTTRETRSGAVQPPPAPLPRTSGEPTESQATPPEATEGKAPPPGRSVLPRRPLRGVRSARPRRHDHDPASEPDATSAHGVALPGPGAMSESAEPEAAHAPTAEDVEHAPVPTTGEASPAGDVDADSATGTDAERDPALSEPEAFPLRPPAAVPTRPEDPPPSAGNADRERWKRRGVYDEDIDALEFAADQIADGGADRAVAFVEDVVALAVALELADLRLLPYVAEHFPRRLDDAPKWTQRERQAVRDVLLHPVRYGDRLEEAGVEPKVVRRMFERLVRVVLTLEKDPSRPLRALALDLMSDRRRLAPYPVLDDVLRRSSWEPAYYQELGRRWAELNPPAEAEPPATP